MNGITIPNTTAMLNWGMPQVGEMAPANYGLTPSPAPSMGLRVDPSASSFINPELGGGGGSMLDRILGNVLPQYNGKGQMTGQGWGGLALGAAQGLFNGYLGLKQYGLAKDQFAEAKRQFGLNYDAQRQTTNASLEDRQRARVASNPGAYQSVADYMSKYGIQGG